MNKRCYVIHQRLLDTFAIIGVYVDRASATKKLEELRMMYDVRYEMKEAPLIDEKSQTNR